MPELARNLFEERNEYLTALGQKGLKQATSDMLKLKSGPTFKLLRTAFKVMSEDAMRSLMYADPVDAAMIAQSQAYAGFLETFDYIVSQSSDLDFLEACFGLANERADSEERAETQKENEFTSFI